MTDKVTLSDMRRVHMPTLIKEQCELAHTYATDGAYWTAYNILQVLTLEVRDHAERIFYKFEG